MKKKAQEYQILDHGMESSSYWNGHGVSHTQWDDTATGIGSTPKEALEDAAEQLASMGWDLPKEFDVEAEKVPDDHIVGLDVYVKLDIKDGKVVKASEIDASAALVSEDENGDLDEDGVFKMKSVSAEDAIEELIDLLTDVEPKVEMPSEIENDLMKQARRMDDMREHYYYVSIDVKEDAGKTKDLPFDPLAAVKAHVKKPVKESRRLKESSGNKILSSDDFNKILKSGSHAWPGGYPIYFITADGEALSFDAAKGNKDLIVAAIDDKGSDKQWEVVAAEINWENPDLYCAHTNKKIECAYCDDDDVSKVESGNVKKPAQLKEQRSSLASDHPELSDVVKEMVADAIDEVATKYEAMEPSVEEVESQRRDGFIPHTNGGWQGRSFGSMTSLEGSGRLYNLPKKASDAIEEMLNQGKDMALDQFIDDNLEALKKIFADEIKGKDAKEALKKEVSYHSLYEKKEGDLAEKLSELEMAMNEDDTVMFEIGSFYYAPESESAKPELYVYGVVNWEAPYHRSGKSNEWVSKQHQFEFSDESDLKKQLDAALKEIVAEMV